MKYILFGMFVFSSLLTIPTFAQMDPDVSNLGDLLIRFCNDEDVAAEGGSRDLQLSTNPEIDEEICIYLVNGGPTEVEVELGFVDGTITNDAEQKKACQPESDREQFGQRVTPEATLFTIPARTTIETRAIVNFPRDTAGIVYGCATLKLVGGPQTDGAIQVVSRRANFIDINVKGILRSSLQVVNQPMPVGWVIHNQDPRFYLISNPTSDELFGKIVLRNDGNVAQYVSVQPTTKRRGRSTSYETISRRILPQQEADFLIALDDKPRWNGSLQISASITSTPIIDEGIDLEDQEIDTNEKRELVTAQAFFIPREIIFGVVGLLFLLLLVTGRRKKSKDTA